MFKRLGLGLLLGLLVGSIVAAVLVKGLGVTVFGAFFAYLFAAVTGVLTGLVAGKPIWAKGGQIEAGLKALVGAGLAALAMFAARKWLTMDLDLSSIGAGVGPAGTLPAASLPLIAAVLAGLYEVDNTPEPEEGKPGAKKGGEPPRGKVRVQADEAADAEEEAEAPAKRAKR